VDTTRTSTSASPTILATEEISLGDFVLSGGEPAALAIVDATVRLLPGAMSDLDSARGDSFFDDAV
jgi:tRNA (guanine37-N1)-methyltransferase